jgi:HTH-type transcriptional regulator / antitoxin HipB
MKTFRQHLKNKLKDKEFKALYEEERQLLDITMKIAQARQKLCISQTALAKKAHITQQQLSKIEKGMNCNMLTFLKVCKALGIRFDLGYGKYKIAI